MVAAAINSRKRKKTDSMADSPPKRVTRARAAKASNDAEAAAPKSKSITTPSARIAAESKPVTRGATTTKTTTKPATRTSARSTRANDAQARNTKGEGSNSLSTAEPVDSSRDMTEPVKPRGRSKKMAEVPNAASVSKPRTRQDQAVSKEKTAVRDTKTLTRSRKASTTDRNNVEEAMAASSLDDETQKTRRARTAPAGKGPTRTATRAAKKVTFDDEPAQGKENIPLASKERKPDPSRSVGIKTKPARKPAATKGVTKRRKAPAKTPSDENTAKDDVLPLSPKKVTQIAKSSSGSSEDELCEKSPVKALAKSPVRSPIKPQPLGLFEASIHNTPEVESIRASGMQSPTRDATKTYMASPAKRPPPSPFKDALKNSPKKFIMAPTPQNARSTEAKSPFKESLLQSPKRGIVMSTSSQAHSPLRASLLGSPARRPVSPTKIQLPISPNKSRMADPFLDTSTVMNDANSGFQNIIPANISDGSFTMAETDEKTENIRRLTSAEFDDEAAWQKRSSPARTITEEAQSSLERSRSAPKTLSPSKRPIASFTSPLFRSSTEDSDSEDELQSGTPTMRSPLKSPKALSRDLGLKADAVTGLSKTPKNTHGELARSSPAKFGMTPLAVQLSSWLASSPEKKHDPQPAQEHRGIFTPVGALRLEKPASGPPQGTISPAKPTFFEDQMAIYETEPVQVLEDHDLHGMVDTIMTDTEEIETSQGSEQYGDENETPVDPQTLVSNQVGDLQPATQPEVRTVTPERTLQTLHRVIHTVSKVPLRSEGEDSPLKVAKKRSKSFSAPLGELAEAPQPIPAAASSVIPCGPKSEQCESASNETPKTNAQVGMPAGESLKTPNKDDWNGAITPTKTVRKGADTQILRGAIVHVDVHTTEGADASGVFVELLTQMGAKCVKQWTWNPRASSGPFSEGSTATEATPSNKVGITHVVFKDGGKRTMQKVRESKGLVLCVGVGWVLE